MMLKNNTKGIALMIFASIAIAVGQFFWKLASGEINFLLITGFVLYGASAVSMIVAFKYGELSKLHPIMTFSYVVAFFLSIFWLEETFSIIQILGVFLIIIGVILLGRSQHE